jgi:hypothetical protein
MAQEYLSLRTVAEAFDAIYKGGRTTEFATLINFDLEAEQWD